MNLRKASWWTRTFIKPKRIIIVEGLLDHEFLPWGGGESRTNYQVGDYLNAPMESGGRALFRVYKVDHSLNPDNLYFYYYEYIKHVH